MVYDGESRYNGPNVTPQSRQGKAVGGGTKDKISLILGRLVTHFGGLGPLDLLEKSRRHDRRMKSVCVRVVWGRGLCAHAQMQRDQQ